MTVFQQNCFLKSCIPIKIICILLPKILFNLLKQLFLLFIEEIEEEIQHTTTTNKMDIEESNQHNYEIEDIHQMYDGESFSQYPLKQIVIDQMEMDINENDLPQSKQPLPQKPTPLSFIKEHTNCTEFHVIYDSDENEFNQRAFQSTVIGRKNVLGIVITENGDVFGSFHTVKIEPTTDDLNWTKDNDFFVFSILKEGEDNYQIYRKNEGVFCKERSIRIVYDDETFYRINNAFYLRPGLYQRRGKTWDDFGKDYALLDEKYFFTTRFGFTPIRVIMYQCF